ncbi:MAG: Hg(II)-responsive transcriptional regulator [Clostridiaceae bacterium]|nr:Hg(II)-responsive transcriptional regulator [Clostridiaceae bacterium]
MNNMTIGKLAKQCGVGVETIRFYEREGLIEEPQRRDSGYRQYPEETARRVRFIKRAKELGFTLKEIRELLDLRLDGEQACDEVRSLAEAKIADIEEKIALLQRMRTTLGELVVACKSNKKTEPCPILRAIEKEDRP